MDTLAQSIKKMNMFYQIEDNSLTRTILKSRRKILENSFRLFASMGIFNTTMVDISSSAGITRRTLYNHYNSKEEIALVLHRLLIDDLLSRSGGEGDKKTFAYLKKSLKSVFHDILMENGIIQFLIHFDQYARENPELFPESELFVNYLLKNSLMGEYLRSIKSQGYFLDDTVSSELLAKVCFESFIAYTDRISYRKGAFHEEGNYVEPDFDLFIDTIFSIISVGGNCGY